MQNLKLAFFVIIASAMGSQILSLITKIVQFEITVDIQTKC